MTDFYFCQVSPALACALNTCNCALAHKEIVNSAEEFGLRNIAFLNSTQVASECCEAD